MIDINLIPPDLRSKRKGSLAGLSLNIPKDIFYGGIGGVLFLIVVIHVILGLMWLGAVGHLSFNKVKWQSIAGDKKILDDINNADLELNKKINALAGLTGKKSMAWSQRLNVISDVLPRGLWFNKIVLEKGALTMDGSVVSKTHDETSYVGNFVSSLKTNQDFMKDFSSLEVNSIQSGKKNSMDVADFIVTAKLKE